MKYKKLIETYNQNTISVLKATFESEGINYYIKGETNTIRPCCNPMIIEVAEDDYDKASDLIKKIDIRYSAFKAFDNEEQNSNENICLSCGKDFPEEDTKCPNCGWSF